jgi:hypothetical protein
MASRLVAFVGYTRVPSDPTDVQPWRDVSKPNCRDVTWSSTMMRMTRVAPIFIGGSGRSGTTQLAAVIGQHPQVWSCPLESRFIVDPGGLEDLTHALTTAYTPFHGTDALSRLRMLLAERLTGAEVSVFAAWDMPAVVGPDRYWAWANEFCGDLTWYSYAEAVERSGIPPTHVTRTVARYFERRDDLLALCRARVDELFGMCARTAGKDVWCEKTPSNVLSAPFLWELFPEAKLIHIVRHPERVVVSHLDQPWAPDDVHSVCSWLEPFYQRFIDLRNDGALNRPEYIEVRLEDLAADWPNQRRQLFTRLGLPDAPTPLGFEPDRHTHHWRTLSADEIAIVRERLAFAYGPLGYECRQRDK